MLMRRDSKLYDVLIAAPLIVLLLRGAYQAVQNITGEMALVVTGFHPPDIVLTILNDILRLAFLCFQIVSVFIRRLPARKSESLVVKIVALLGSQSMALLALLQAVGVTPPLRIASLVITAIGLCGSCYALFYLRCAFSLLPEARVLVTRGPYWVVRHPLYFFEMLAFFGVSLIYEQPLSSLLVLLVIAAQLIRMGYEERVLTAQFPTYAEYARNTARIIPRVY
jgi:protein-S-isoprenylcysteine O-methyltransferase Ste14